MRGDVVIKLELKLGDSSVILSADVQDLKDLKPEIKRFIEIIMKHVEIFEPFLQKLAEQMLLQKKTDTSKTVVDLEKGPVEDCMAGHA